MLKAYKRLFGFLRKSDTIRNSISILLGPVAIALGCLFLLDLYCDKLDGKNENR